MSRSCSELVFQEVVDRILTQSLLPMGSVIEKLNDLQTTTKIRNPEETLGGVGVAEFSWIERDLQKHE